MNGSAGLSVGLLMYAVKHPDRGSINGSASAAVIARAALAGCCLARPEPSVVPVPPASAGRIRRQDQSPPAVGSGQPWSGQLHRDASGRSAPRRRTRDDSVMAKGNNQKGNKEAKKPKNENADEPTVAAETPETGRLTRIERRRSDGGGPRPARSVGRVTSQTVRESGRVAIRQGGRRIETPVIGCVVAWMKSSAASARAALSALPTVSSEGREGGGLSRIDERRRSGARMSGRTRGRPRGMPPHRLSPATGSPRSRAVPRRSSAGRTRPPSAAPARRTC